jgi:uncharacterized protein YkwD
MKRLVLFCALAGLLATPAFADERATTTPAGEKTTAAKVVVAPVRPQLHEHPTLLQMLRRNNDVRGRRGLRPHRINPELTKAAQDHAVYMARTGSFSHYSNGGPQGRASRWGFRGMVRENIAMGQHDVNSAFHSWQNSSGHYASIVSGTTDAGFGYAVGPNGQGYWVALYGTAP